MTIGTAKVIMAMVQERGGVVNTGGGNPTRGTRQGLHAFAASTIVYPARYFGHVPIAETPNRGV